MEGQYTNREIDSHFKDIKEQLDRIEGQTIRTNGRVTKLESWQSLIIGGSSIVTLFVIPLLIWIFTENVSGIRTSLDATKASLELHEKQDKVNILK